MAALSASKMAQRTALALNNRAVGLLQQGDFVGANKLCSTSASLLECLLDEQQQEQASASYLDAASSCAASSATASTPLSSALELFVVEDGDFSALRSAMQYGCSSSVFFPVILRDNHGSDDTNTNQHHIGVARQHALVLYNRAVICLVCHYQHKYEQQAQHPRQPVPEDAVDPTRALRMARKFLNRASAALCGVAEEHSAQEPTTPSSAVAEDAYTTTRIELILASALVLNYLSLTLRVLKHMKKASVALQAAQNLSDLLDQEEAETDAAAMENLSTPAGSVSSCHNAASLFAPMYLSPAA